MSEPLAADQPQPITRPLATTLAILGSLVRLVPHGWNFSPSYAVEIYAGARLRSWHAFAIPLAVRFVTDMGILLFPFKGQEGMGAFYLRFMPWVYLSVIANVFLGRLLQRTESPWKIGGVALLASLQFYLTTNFGSWLCMPEYPKTAAGLLSSYVAGLPFFRPTLIANLVFVPVLFGAHAVLARWACPRERVMAPAH